MKFFGFILLCCCCALGTLRAQTMPPSPKEGKNDTIKTLSANVDGEMIPWIVTQEVRITDSRIFKSQADKDAFNRLRYNIYKVIPYAHLAGARYRQLQRDLALTGDKKKQKELIVACETQIKNLFKQEVENLTISQGEVLIKLIDRETNNTSYELVKELKGGFNAFLLQSVARVFGHNLKETYDKDEQRDIEQILQQAGYDSYKNE
jgi:hypothetical protein